MSDHPRCGGLLGRSNHNAFELNQNKRRSVDQMRRDFTCHKAKVCDVCNVVRLFRSWLSAFLTSDNPGIACNRFRRSMD